MPDGYIKGSNGQLIELIDAKAREGLAKKLPTPATAKVGDYLRISAVNTDGSFTVEAVAAPTVPTKVSAFENDAGYQTEAQVNALLAAFPTFEIQVVAQLPAEGAEKTIYLVPFADDSGSYLEYLYVNGAWEIIGSRSGENVAQMEPMEDDIPKVFFVGTTPTTKAEDELPLTMEYVSKTKRFFTYVTLKVQGDSSAGYPLKNFNMKMFTDEARTQKLKMKFRGWKVATHKFCLKKNWIDILNIRNVFNGRLWGQVVRTRADYEDYPAEYRESSNCGAVDGFPIKVYVNGVYQGLYTWNIRKDDSMFGMDDSTGTHAALIADSANDAVLWRALPNIDGTDWTDELNDTPPDAVLTGFRNAVNFVMTASDADFKANIGQYFYKSSLTDFYAFIYAIQMVGGLGKSQTMFTYDAKRFFANIYDMDTTWRLMWSGGGFYPVNMTCPEGYMQISGGGKSNLLYERFVKAFPDEIRERYFELRKGPLSTANVINEAERFSDPLVAAGLYAEEVASTTPYGTSRPSKDTNTIQHLRQSITDRLAFVDEQMAQLRSPVAATSVTLSAASLVFDDKEPQTLTATVEPADTTDTVEWVSSNDDIATVADGVVTPVSNGSCTITATAGTVSAECAITVQYAEKYCTSVTLSASELAFTSKEPQTLTATVEPSDTTDVLTWESSDNTVVAVEDGVVTPKWNGTATVTAVCGGQRAECAITVEGIEASPLDGVVLNNGYCYNTTSGELEAKDNYFATSKFRLDDGNYTISVARGLKVSLHVWDGDNYLGYAQHNNTSADGANPTIFRVLADPNYVYALSWNTTLVDTDTIDSVTVTKNAVTAPAATQSWTMSDLTFEKNDTYTARAVMTDASFQHDISDVAKANHLVVTNVMGQVVNSRFPLGTNAFVIRWVSTNGVYTPRVCFMGSADEVTAYFAEHESVLTFN